MATRSRRARLTDIRDIALALPEVTEGDGERPAYAVRGKTFAWFREPRKDAVDPDTGERMDDVIGIHVPELGDKDALVQEWKEARKAALQEGLKKATRVPLRTMELVDEAWAPLLEITRYGQYSSRSDVEVGAKALEAASYGAYRNVVINLAGIRDDGFRDDLQRQADALLARAAERGEQVRASIDGRSGDA